MDPWTGQALLRAVAGNSDRLVPLASSISSTQREAHRRLSGRLCFEGVESMSFSLRFPLGQGAPDLPLFHTAPQQQGYSIADCFKAAPAPCQTVG